MFSNPQHNIAELERGEGMIVADLGSGSGHNTIELARRVGSGKVYAIDIQKELLARVKNNATHGKLHNVEVIWADFDKLHGTGLADASVHRVLASNVLFQLENKDAAISEIKRILKPDGKVYLIDWLDSFGNTGPHAKDIVTRVKAKELFTQSGFVFEKEFPAGAHHYGIIFKR